MLSYCVSCGSTPLQTGQARSRSATPSAGDAVKRSTAANKRKADAQPADAAKRVGCCASNILWVHQSASSIREQWLSSGKAKQGRTTMEQSRARHPCNLAPCLTCIPEYAQAKTRGCYRKPFDPLAGEVRCPGWRCDRGGDCCIHARSRANPIQPADIALQEARGDHGAAQGFHSQGEEAGQAAGGGAWQEMHCPQINRCCHAKTNFSANSIPPGNRAGMSVLPADL